MMSRAALAISLLALIIALYTAGNEALHPPTLSRAWGQGVVTVLREYDRRLTALERKP